MHVTVPNTIFLLAYVPQSFTDLDHFDAILKVKGSSLKQRVKCIEPLLHPCGRTRTVGAPKGEHAKRRT